MMGFSVPVPGMFLGASRLESRKEEAGALPKPHSLLDS